MNLNRFLSVVAVSVILVAGAVGCTKSALKEMSLFRSDKVMEAENLHEADQDASASLAVWHDSFEAAKAASAKSGKPILADFTGSDWCHWCIKLKEDVFEKAEFKQWARQNVTLLELDYPRKSSQSPTIKKQNSELAKKYNIRGYPTVLLLTEDGDVLGKLGYEKDPATWIESAEAILAK